MGPFKIKVYQIYLQKIEALKVLGKVTINNLAIQVH